MDSFCKFLEERCNSVTLNMNDTFGYASADSVEISYWDLQKLKKLYAEYGQDAFIAYAALKKRKLNPIPPLITPAYKKAKEEVLYLRKQRELWFD